MRMTAKVEQLKTLIEPAVSACGVELWGIEFSPQGKRSLLRVYIEAVDAAPVTAGPSDNQVGVDDCKRVSHQVSGVLDVSDPISGEFVLEVSTPGWDRRFFKPEQLTGYENQKMQLKLIRPVDGQRRFTGLYRGLSEEQVHIETLDGENQHIALSNIDKLTLVID